MAGGSVSNMSCEVERPLAVASVKEDAGFLEATRSYSRTVVRTEGERMVAEPRTCEVRFRTATRVPRTGLLLVGLCGNNGTTLAAGLIANKMKLKYETNRGEESANWLGSVAMTGTCKIGFNEETGEEIYMPVRSLLPMLHPDDLVLGGWDINALPMDEAIRRAGVMPLEVQRAVRSQMAQIEVFPGVYNRDFIATNQEVRADYVMSAKTKAEQLAQLRKDIQTFKAKHDLEKVIVLWNGNTERFSAHVTGVHDSAAALLAAIEANTEEIAPSLLYCVAALQEGCSYINGSPQNTFCEGVYELAKQQGVYVAGDDLKTGQTKFKSVMADFMVSTGLKPLSIVSYNHLGNNDGLNLSSEKQFRSKEITKASVVDDMIASNRLLYKEGEHPDHLIVIKYVPTVGDSKRALDEYTTKIFMNGLQTVVVHNTCEDSLLAAPIILDLVLFMELLQRISVAVDGGDYQRFDSILSLLSLFLKAPQVPKHAPVVNALFPQKEALIDLLRAAAGLPPTDHLALPCRLPKHL